ncbi:hypothetical protein ScPMuIL_015809 [Solemya velum]
MKQQKCLLQGTWRAFACLVTGFGLVQLFTLLASPMFGRNGAIIRQGDMVHNEFTVAQMQEMSLPKSHPVTSNQSQKHQSQSVVDTLEKIYASDAALRRKVTGPVPPMLKCVSNLLDGEGNSTTDCAAQLVAGIVRPRKSLLTIGVPTVGRPGRKTSYLKNTLDSLVSQTTTTEKNVVTVVILVADNDDAYLTKVRNLVNSRYKAYSGAGFILIAKTNNNSYPDLSLLQKDKRDSKERVVWRSKQNLDFASLLFFSYNLSTYYMQLEDDVISATSFLADITKFIENQTNSWTCLEFSKLGFIGKLFKSSDLLKLSHILLRFYQKEPCDLLLPKFIRIMGQKGPIHKKPGLFQHIGRVSSLKNKMMPSIDADFKDIGNTTLPNWNIPKGDNPPAKIETDLKAYSRNYSREYAYSEQSFFWAVDPKPGKYLQVVFENPQNISRLVIVTGDERRRTDSLRTGELLISAEGDKTLPPCEDSIKIGKFVDGEFDSEVQGLILPTAVKCLIIKVTKAQRHWLIIRQIHVVLL